MKTLLIAAGLILTMTGSAFAHGWGREYRGGRCEHFRPAPRCERGYYHDRYDRHYNRGYRYGGYYGGCRRGW